MKCKYCGRDIKHSISTTELVCTRVSCMDSLSEDERSHSHRVAANTPRISNEQYRPWQGE